MAAPLQTRTTVPASHFVDAIGVNLHMEYTDGKYADAQAVMQDLEYLGIRNVRDGVPRPTQWLPPGQAIAAVDLLAKKGVHFDIAVGGDTQVSADLEQLRILERKHPGIVLSVEGPNEINNWPMKDPAMTNEQAAEKFQHELYDAVHAEPSLKGVPVYYFTGGDRMDLRAHPGLADVANTHPYPHNGEQPEAWLRRDYEHNFAMPPQFPRAITETGYYTLPKSRDWGGVDSQTQGKLMLSLIFDAVEQGNQHTYIYQLLEPYPNAEGKSLDTACGLFLLNNEPKPAAVAIHNLFGLFREASSQPQTVALSVEGLPGTGHSMVLSKHDGTVFVALWNEAPVWDMQAQQPLSPPAVDVAVSVDGPGDAYVYDPLTDSRSFVKRMGAGYTVAVPDHPVLLVLQKGAHR